MTTAPLSLAFPEHLAARQAAQRRDRSIILGMVALSAACLVAAGFLVPPMNEVRRENQLVINPETVEGLPPDIELLGKLGTFRALAIDWAFIRAERLKEEGKHYEAYQLASLICKLQPRFASVWAHQAWNMAYNISVTEYSPEARWQWVNNGIKLLRDEAIRFNPRSITLYKELAWIYWHKIGDFLDDEHMNYKKALAVEMEAVLGPPALAVTTAETIDEFRKIAEAPEVSTLLANDAEAAALAEQLRQRGLPPDRVLLEFVARHVRPWVELSELTLSPQAEDSLHQRRLALLKDPAHQEALQRLLAAVRADVLRRDYNLDPTFMLALMEDFGPLDWRAAWAHCIYWSVYGDQKVIGQLNINVNDSMNTVRFIFFGLRQAFQNGRLVLTPDFDNAFDSYIEFMPDIRYIPYLFDAYLAFGKAQFGDRPDFVENTPGPNYWTGFVTDLHRFIGLLYFEGTQASMDQAQQYYDYLREYNKDPMGRTQAMYMVPLSEFVLMGLKQELQTYHQANSLIRGWVQKHFRELALGNVQAANGSLATAQEFYGEYMGETALDAEDRRKFQPFRVMRADELKSFMTRSDIPILYKVRLWRRLELDATQLTWDYLNPYFEKMCQAENPPLDPLKAFPEPPGMEEFRKTDIDVRHDIKKDFERGER